MRIPTTLIDCQVWRTAFDYQVRLTLIGRDPDEGYRVDAELVIETPFRLRDAAGEWHELDPASASRYRVGWAAAEVAALLAGLCLHRPSWCGTGLAEPPVWPARQHCPSASARRVCQCCRCWPAAVLRAVIMW